MHSAHHSRGRIAFEVFCAFALAGSLAGAWAQTDAWALLSAAAIAALYGVWHSADLRRPAAAEAAPADLADQDQGDLLDYQRPLAPPVVQPPEVSESPMEAIVDEGAKPSRKAKPRAGRGRKEAQPTIAEIADKLEREIGKIGAEAEAPAPDPQPEPEVHLADGPGDAPEYVPATPLFETEPFVRQQRAAFGRKARR